MKNLNFKVTNISRVCHNTGSMLVKRKTKDHPKGERSLFKLNYRVLMQGYYGPMLPDFAQSYL